MKRYPCILLAMLIFAIGLNSGASAEIVDIEITKPHNNQLFQAGDDIDIQWIMGQQYPEMVKIDLDLKGEVASNIYLTPPDGIENTGSFTGMIPDLIEHGEYTLRVGWKDGPNSGYSGTVSIRINGQAIEITAPQDDSLYAPGDNLSITWNSTPAAQQNLNIWLRKSVYGEAPLTITPPGGVADTGASSWAIPNDFQMGKYQLGIETSDQSVDDVVEIFVMSLNEEAGELLERFIPHIDRPNPGHKFADFCQQHDTYGALYHVSYSLSSNYQHALRVSIKQSTGQGFPDAPFTSLDIQKAELVSGPGYTYPYHVTKQLCLPQGFYQISAAAVLGDSQTSLWSKGVNFYVNQDPKLIGDGPVPGAVKEIGCPEFTLESPTAGQTYLSAQPVPIKVRSPVANADSAGTSVHVQLSRKVPGTNNQWDDQFKVWMVKTSDMTEMVSCWTWHIGQTLEPGDYRIIAALDNSLMGSQDVVNSGYISFSVKTATVDAGKIPALKDLSSMQFGASKASFNLKNKAVFILPEKDVKLKFQRREGSMWRMVAAPQLLGSRKVTSDQGVLSLKEYRFKKPGLYRYRIDNGPWEEFEIKGGLSPKTDKALLPAVKLDKGASAKGPMLKPAKITALRSGQTFTPKDRIKLKADYDRSHQIDFVLQQKRGSSYRTLKKVGNGNFGKLKPGDYRVGVAYTADKKLPDKWIEFTVAEGKKLKVTPPATKKINPGSSPKKIPTIDLN